MSSLRPRPEPSVTSRRALLLGSAALPLASCGLLGSRGTSGRSDDATSGGGGSDGQGAPGSASDGGGNGSAPRVTTEGWATPSDLESTPPDLAAADRRYGTTRGQMERKDPYGSWISPGFPTDGEVLNPTVQVDGVDSFTDEQVTGIGASVLVHTIVTILDSPLAFEKDNARATEVSPELVKGFHLEGIEPHAFDAVFTEQLLLSGTADPKQSAADRYHVRPKPYEAGRPRLHLLDHGVRIRPAQFDWEGPSIHASARGVIPVTTESGDELFFREASLVLNPGEGKNEGAW